jgi:hypothetical protein
VRRYRIRTTFERDSNASLLGIMLLTVNDDVDLHSVLWLLFPRLCPAIPPLPTGPKATARGLASTSHLPPVADEFSCWSHHPRCTGAPSNLAASVYRRFLRFSVLRPLVAQSPGTVFFGLSNPRLSQPRSSDPTVRYFAQRRNATSRRKVASAAALVAECGYMTGRTSRESLSDTGGLRQIQAPKLSPPPPPPTSGRIRASSPSAFASNRRERPWGSYRAKVYVAPPFFPLSPGFPITPREHVASSPALGRRVR